MKKIKLLCLSLLSVLFACALIPARNVSAFGPELDDRQALTLVHQYQAVRAEAEDEDERSKEKVLDIHPTQLAVGMRSVKEKSKNLAGKSDKELKRYLKDHPVPVVLGPNKKMYMIDHHHLTRAAWEADIKKVYVVVQADLSRSRNFWGEMEAKKWVYPYDQFGVRRAYSEIPGDVRGLADDPYRSLAGAVRDEGGYDKNETPFSEFRWAEFFRTRIARELVNRDFDKAVQDGVRLAKSPAARGLPGYSGR
ncbi:MAG: hypothetical protein HY078_00935 [Elusimicrobia bacterium]|nr:hypothetical protein [Elusimicrobiota bacterium]